jgi:hypothetical protein
VADTAKDSNSDASLDGIADVSDAGTDGSDRTPPTVVTVSPASSAMNAEPGAALQATFSEALQASTVNAGSFTVTHDGQPVAGTVGISGAVATFTPNQRLTLLGDYTATLSTAITDLAGNALAATYTWTFRARDGAWKPSAVVDSTGVSSQQPKVASDRHGRAIAVWQADSGSAHFIYANRYAWGGTWDSQKVEVGTAAALKTPQIVLDAQGNGIAVWLQQHPTSMQWHVWGALYASNSWQTASVIANTADSSDVRVAVDGAGNATVVWVESDGTRLNLLSKTLPFGGAWGAVQGLETQNVGDVSSPELAVNGVGDEIVVWSQFDGTRTRI